MDLDPGTIVANRYRISRPLGRGGMGEVFAAENIRTGRPVAIKLLRQDAKTKATAIARFRQEARAAGQINSDHVTQVLDVEDDPEHGVVLVFELLEGESLIDRLKRTGPIPFDELWPIIEQVWLGLADAHRAGIIHRDLKPSNVFLERRPDGSTRVKILDFGISKVPKEAGGETLTEMGQSLGTFSFMPPEQIGKAKTVDHRADIYACATLIYQSLSGQLPYSARNILVMVEMKSKTDARKLGDAMGGPVDARLEAFVARGLARDPAQRFSTAVEALAAWRDLRPAPASSQPAPPQSAVRTRSQPPPNASPPVITENTPLGLGSVDPHLSPPRGSAPVSVPRAAPAPVIMESAGPLPRVNSEGNDATSDETGATLAMPIHRVAKRGAAAQVTPPLAPRVDSAAASIGHTTPMRAGGVAGVAAPRVPVGPGGTQPVVVGRALDHLKVPEAPPGEAKAAHAAAQPVGYYTPAGPAQAQGASQPVATGRSGLPVAYDDAPASDGEARTKVYRPDEAGRRSGKDGASAAPEAKPPVATSPAPAYPQAQPSPGSQSSVQASPRPQSGVQAITRPESGSQASPGPEAGGAGSAARPPAQGMKVAGGNASLATQPKRGVPILVVLVGFLLVGFAVVAGAMALFTR